MALEEQLQHAGSICPSVYAEVVDQDQYRLSSIKPNGSLCFLDVGASIGIFSLQARKRFPHASILAVEPNNQNFASLLENTEGCHIQCLQGALAPDCGPLYEHIGENPAVHHYHPHSRYKPREMLEGEGFVPSQTKAFSLPQLAAKLPTNYRTIIKIDIETAEWYLVNDEAAEKVLKSAEQVHMELHYAHHWLGGTTREQFAVWAEKFKPTHVVEIVPLGELSAILHMTAHGS